jgi:hypothetical protein
VREVWHAGWKTLGYLQGESLNREARKDNPAKLAKKISQSARSNPGKCGA